MESLSGGICSVTFACTHHRLHLANRTRAGCALQRHHVQACVDYSRLILLDDLNPMGIDGILLRRSA